MSASTGTVPWPAHSSPVTSCHPGQPSASFGGSRFSLNPRVIHKETPVVIVGRDPRRPTGESVEHAGRDRVELTDVPELNFRRNEPSIDGAFTEFMSSIDSAPASIPAASESALVSAFAPLSVGPVNCSCATAESPAA